MSFAVEFTTGARQDLLKIYRYIKAAGRPEAAKGLYEQLSKACDSLSQHPERGSVHPNLKASAKCYAAKLSSKTIG